MRRQALGGKVPKTWLVRGVLRWGLLGGKVPKTWLVRGVLISRGGGPRWQGAQQLASEGPRADQTD